MNHLLEPGVLHSGIGTRFAEYAALVHDRLGDRGHLWATVNEPWCVAFEGDAAGVHAPGRREPVAAVRAAHHLLLGHGLAALHLHEAGCDGVGIGLNVAPVWPACAAAADTVQDVDAIANRMWLDPRLDGRYAADVVELAAGLSCKELVRDGDLALVQDSLDLMGSNDYAPTRVDVASPDEAPDPSSETFPGVERLTVRPREPRTAIGWEIEPRGLEEVLVRVDRRVPDLPLVVSENGAASAATQRDGSGAVIDQDRIDDLASHIAAVQRARHAGVDVRAYGVSTRLDNFEWDWGYGGRVGLVATEPGTLCRIPTASFRWYAERVRAGGEAA